MDRMVYIYIYIYWTLSFRQVRSIPGSNAAHCPGMLLVVPNKLGRGSREDRMNTQKRVYLLPYYPCISFITLFFFVRCQKDCLIVTDKLQHFSLVPPSYSGPTPPLLPGENRPGHMRASVFTYIRSRWLVKSRLVVPTYPGRHTHRHPNNDYYVHTHTPTSPNTSHTLGWRRIRKLT